MPGFLDHLENLFGLPALTRRVAALEQKTAALEKNTMLTKAKIIALLAIISQLQNTDVADEAKIADLQKQIADIRANDAELQDPDLIASVDAVVGNAATTPPPANE